MARAEAAHASTRSDSIKGLAQSVARPAYRRLLGAEPALRRAVPLLIIAFLVTVGVGAVVQIYQRHSQAIIEAFEDIDGIADVIADRLERSAKDGRVEAADRTQDALDRVIPPR